MPLPPAARAKNAVCLANFTSGGAAWASGSSLHILPLSSNLTDVALGDRSVEAEGGKWDRPELTEEAEALSELMTQSATVSDQDEIFDKIKLAIHDRVTIEFEYREINDTSTVRVVNPHLLGLMDNTATMDAYQIAGESCEGRIPGWRRFRLANIVKLKRSTNRFEPRSEFKVTPRRWKGVFESIDRLRRATTKR